MRVTVLTLGLLAGCFGPAKPGIDDTTAGAVEDDTASASEGTGAGGEDDGATDDGGAADDGATTDDGGADGGDDGGAGAGSGTDDGGGTGGDSGGEDPVPDFRAAGGVGVTRSSGSLSLSGGCTLSYTRFAPDAAGARGVRVVLTHGFLRSGANMEGWGEHLASWGFDAVVPTTCRLSDHAANGADVVSLHAALGGGPVIYAGQSAGGLASLYAALGDSGSIGLIGLDAVDGFFGDGAGVAAGLGVPAFGLVGEPGSCNSNNNYLPVYAAAPDATALRLDEADHCDFEASTDFGCTVLCDYPNTTYDDATISSAVTGLMTAAAVALTGDAAAEAAWWAPGGSYYDALDATGILQRP